MNLKVIHSKNIRWVDIVNPQQEELAYLKKNFAFDSLDYDDILNFSQHAKMEARGSYHLLVLLFPVFNEHTREISPGEVDFFIGKDFLVTIHYGQMHTMNRLVNEAQNDPLKRGQFLAKNSGYLLYQILEMLFRRSFPILDHISKDMNEIEKNIFADLSVKMLERISLMKRNIIDFRRIMKTHHLLIKRLTLKKESYLTFSDSKKYYTSLLEHAENIWDILAIQKETIEALQDANQSLATNKLNEVTKVITIFSGTFLPATLVLFAFGLSVKDVPFGAHPHGFTIVLAIAGGASLLALIYFKLRKWI